MLFTKLSIVSGFIAVAAAQTASTTVSQSMPPTATQGFNPNEITSTDRFNWCHAQLNTCPLICGGETLANSCDQVALTYNCICANGTAPDVTAYSYTLPFYICQQTYIQCVNSHPNDAQSQQTCKDIEQCGTLNATANAAATSSSSSAPSSTMATSTASTASARTGSASGSATTTSPSNAAVHGQQLATGAFAAILLAAMKLFL